LFLQAQKDRIVYSSFKLRIWNEGATIFLVSIIFIVILGGAKHGGGFDWKWGLLGILIFALALYLAILLYRRIRGKKGAGEGQELSKDTDPNKDVAKR
jgi:putative membrane protein